jgi:hypothetical protein
MLFSFLYSTEYELIGVYIGEKGRIKDEYVHFSYQYKYERHHNTIIIKPNEAEIPNYFGNSILGVTAFVGQNGSNKTTLIECVAEILIQQFIEGETFGVLYRSKKSGVFHYRISHSVLIKTDKIQFKVPSKLLTEKIKPFEYFHERKRPVIIISSQFDNRNYHRNRKQHIIYHDFTTNYLVYQDQDSLDDALYIEDNFVVHRRRQSKRQLELLTNFKSNLKLFEFINYPDTFFLQISKINADSVSNDLSIKSSSILKRIDKKLNVSFNAEGYNENLETFNGSLRKAKFWFYRNMFSLYFLLLNEEMDIDLNLLDIELDETSIKGEKGEKIVEDFFKKQNWIKKEEFDFNKCIQGFISLVDSLCISTSEDNNSASFEFKIEDKDKLFLWIDSLESFIYNHYNKYKSHELTLDFITIDWRDMSSGEYAFLDLFSRIFAAVKSIRVNKSHRCIPIFIDEPDLYLHPELQRQLLHKLFEFLSALHLQFKEESYFYLLFSTHSPFLVSDLPKETIKLLGKSGANYPIKSLGANIYETLSAPFFLNNGFIGDHIKSKIELLLSDINQKKINSERFESYQKLINAIDDELIKGQLSQMLRRAYDQN